MAQVTAICQPEVQHDSRQALRTAIIIAIPAVALALYASSQEAWGAMLVSWPFLIATLVWFEIYFGRLRRETAEKMAQFEARRTTILARQAS